MVAEEFVLNRLANPQKVSKKISQRATRSTD